MFFRRTKTPQPHVSKLMNGNLESFSAERLLRTLLKLGHNIDIVIKIRKSASTTGALTLVGTFIGCIIIILVILSEKSLRFRVLITTCRLR